MEIDNSTAQAVLECANKVLGRARTLEEGTDIPLEELGFDSLSLFAFFIELKTRFGIEFEELLASQEQMLSVCSVARVVANHRLKVADSGGVGKQG